MMKRKGGIGLIAILIGSLVLTLYLGLTTVFLDEHSVDSDLEVSVQHSEREAQAALAANAVYKSENVNLTGKVPEYYRSSSSQQSDIADEIEQEAEAVLSQGFQEYRFVIDDIGIDLEEGDPTNLHRFYVSTPLDDKKQVEVTVGIGDYEVTN